MLYNNKVKLVSRGKIVPRESSLINDSIAALIFHRYVFLCLVIEQETLLSRTFIRQKLPGLYLSIFLAQFPAGNRPIFPELLSDRNCSTFTCQLFSFISQLTKKHLGWRLPHHFPSTNNPINPGQFFPTSDQFPSRIRPLDKSGRKT